MFVVKWYLETKILGAAGVPCSGGVTASCSSWWTEPGCVIAHSLHSLSSLCEHRTEQSSHHLRFGGIPPHLPGRTHCLPGLERLPLSDSKTRLPPLPCILFVQPWSTCDTLGWSALDSPLRDWSSVEVRPPSSSLSPHPPRHHVFVNMASVYCPNQPPSWDLSLLSRLNIYKHSSTFLLKSSL